MVSDDHLSFLLEVYMASTVYVNGKPLPSQETNSKVTVSTTVDYARNANAEVVGQRVGRDLYKIELEWKVLSAYQWSEILKLFKDFYVIVRLPDQVNNDWQTIKMYCSDRTAEIYDVDILGLPIRYVNCKVNLIDCGVME